MIHEVNDEILALAGGSGTKLGIGGMVTKLQAAQICLSCGCAMVITNGNDPDHLYDILDGKPIGTTFKL
jgi:glutamate 5-kinase